MAIVLSKEPPKVPGLPILGNALNMRFNPLLYLLELYREYGPVYRLHAFNKHYTVMAGIEANRFLAREGEKYLGSETLFGEFGREMGSDAFMVALDGVPHRHQRKVQRTGYSRDAILRRLPEVIDLARHAATQWQSGKNLPVLPTMQRIVTEQLGLLLTNHPCGDYFDDLQFLFTTNLKVNVMEMLPKVVMLNPRYPKAKARSYELAQKVLDWHIANPPGEHRSSDLVDDLLNAVDENGQPYSQGTIRTAILGAYFAGMDTVASTASFMLYCILKNPDVLKRLYAEVDEAFSGDAFSGDAFPADGLTAEKLRRMPVLHGAAMETLRLYPVAAFTPRIVIEPFEFEGYQLQTGTEVLVANGITHYMPEYYPEPDRFDVDRYDRPDHPKVAQAFAPYTLGAHTCLGAGMAEVQLMTVIATLLHTVELELTPPDYEITVYATPIPNPGRKFAVKVIGQRQTP